MAASVAVKEQEENDRRFAEELSRIENGLRTRRRVNFTETDVDGDDSAPYCTDTGRDSNDYNNDHSAEEMTPYNKSTVVWRTRAITRLRHGYASVNAEQPTSRNAKTSQANPLDESLVGASPQRGSGKRRSRGITAEEKALFLEGLELYGRNVKAIAQHMGYEGTTGNLRSLLQMHLIKLFREGQLLPRKVIESGCGYTLSGKTLNPAAGTAVPLLKRWDPKDPKNRAAIELNRQGKNVLTSRDKRVAGICNSQASVDGPVHSRKRSRKMPHNEQSSKASVAVHGGTSEDTEPSAKRQRRQCRNTVCESGSCLVETFCRSGVDLASRPPSVQNQLNWTDSAVNEEGPGGESPEGFFVDQSVPIEIKAVGGKSAVSDEVSARSSSQAHYNDSRSAASEQSPSSPFTDIYRTARRSEQRGMRNYHSETKDYGYLCRRAECCRSDADEVSDEQRGFADGAYSPDLRQFQLNALRRTECELSESLSATLNSSKLDKEARVHRRDSDEASSRTSAASTTSNDSGRARSGQEPRISEDFGYGAALFSNSLSHKDNRSSETASTGRASNAHRFGVTVAASSMAVMDIHAHLSHENVVGLLAGDWDPDAKCLRILAAHPCRARTTHSGTTIASADQDSLNAARADIHARGMAVVGWYRSSRKFAADPTDADIAIHSIFRGSFLDNSTGAVPFVCAVVSPYDDELHTTESSFAWLATQADELHQRPRPIACYLVQERGLSRDSIDAVLALVEHNAASPGRARLHESWLPEMTRFAKLLRSATGHFMAASSGQFRADLLPVPEVDAVLDLPLLLSEKLLEVGWTQ